MSAEALTLTKAPRHQSASTNHDYWAERYPMMVASMVAVTGKPSSEVIGTLVQMAETPFANDGAVISRFTNEHISA